MPTSTKTIGELVTWVKGKKPRHLFENENENTVPYLSAAYFRTRKPDYYASENDKDCVLVNEEDIVLIWDGSNAGDVFRGLKGVLSSTMVRFNKSKECSDDFLYFLMKDNFKNLNGATTGSTIPHVSGSVLKEIEIPILDIAEQKEVGRSLTIIQNAIAEQERLIAKLKELKRSMTQDLFTNGTKGEKTKMTDIGEIPESWEMMTVKDAIERLIIEKPIDGNHGNIHPKSRDFVSEGIPFIMASNLVGNKVDMENCHFISKSQADKLQKGFSYEGDVLLSHKATIGRTAIVHDLTTEYIMLTPQVTYYRVKDNERLLNYFLRHFFDSNHFQKEIKRIAGDGSTRAYIGILKQQILPIVLPPLDEQKRIVDVLDSIDGKIDATQQRLSTYQELFKTLLHELMSGERRIKNI